MQITPRDYNLPMPATLSKEEKDNWNSTPLESKILRTLKSCKENLNKNVEENAVLLERCWKASEGCSSSQKMLEIREACMELSPSRGAEWFKIECSNGFVDLPIHYQFFLSKDSDFFHGLFSENFKEKKSNQFFVPDITKEHLEKLLDIWEGSAVEDLGEALEILEASNQLGLYPKALIDVLPNAVNSLEVGDEIEVESALNLGDRLNQQVFPDEINQLKKPLGDYFMKSYFLLLDKGLNENASRCLELAFSFDATHAIDHLVLEILQLSTKDEKNIKLFLNLTQAPIEIRNALGKVLIKKYENLLKSGKNEEADACLNDLKRLNITRLDLNESSLDENQLKNLLSQFSNIKELSLHRVNPDVIKEIVKFKELTYLDISDCIGVEDQTIQQLTELKNLTHLDVSSCYYLTTSALKEITTHFPELRSLNLSDCYRIKNLTGISNLTKLEHLNLRNCNTKVKDSLMELTHLKKLISLNLSHNQRPLEIPNEVVKNLAASLTELKDLNLMGTSITNNDIIEIAKLKNLESLNLSLCPITNNAIEELTKLPKLTSLILAYCTEITDDSAEHFAKMKRLTSLNVMACKIGDLFINAAVTLKLKSLSVAQCEQVSDDMMAQISKIKTLESLDISGCSKLTDKAAIELAKLINLSTLNMAATSMTDSAVETFAPSLINLAELYMVGCPVTDLKDISKLTNLRTVDLRGCREVNNEAIIELAKLENLTWLGLARIIDLTEEKTQLLIETIRARGEVSII